MKTASPPIGLSADPVITSRDALLDPDAVAEQIARFRRHDVTIEWCRLRRAKYRISESLRVVYDVVADGHAFVMSARTFTDSAAAFRKAPPATPVHGMPGIAHDPQTSSVWWTVPNDRRLRNLGTLLDPPSRVRLSSGIDWQHSTLIEYAPERSATVRIHDDQGLVSGYAKAYRDRDAFDVAAQCNRVAALVALVDGLRTPTALGWARPDRIVVLEPLPGLPWTQLQQRDQPIAVQRFGAALAHVHELPSELSHGPFQRYRSERVRNSAALVGVARPDVAAAAHRLRDQLAAGPPTPTTAVYLHGDVHANNVLFHGDEVNMIDFDQGGTGAASADLGSMLASLMTLRLVNPDAAVEGLGAAFLDGYSAVRPLPSTAELAWYTAAACVAERAIRAVNRVNLPVLEVLPQVLEMAEATLAGRVSLDG
jgi:aminoglycoside phosphotransferase